MKRRMERFEQGDIVFVPFPHTNLRSKKFRPALVISNASLRGDDVVLCGISSQKPKAHYVEVDSESLEKGLLPVTSFVKVNKLVSLDRSIVKRKMAKISRKKLKEVISCVVKIFEV